MQNHYKTAFIGLTLMTVLSVLILEAVFHAPKKNRIKAVYANIKTDKVLLNTTNQTSEERPVYGSKILLKYKDYFVPRKKKITPLDFKFLITSESMCSSNTSPTLLVMVMSMPSKIKMRQAVRTSWGRVATGHPWPGRKLNGTIKLIFLLGDSRNATTNTDLVIEAHRTKDIVQADFRESYFNLSYKVLVGYKWVEQFCPGAEYIMKIDDDTFFNVPYIMDLIKTRRWNNTIYGPFSYADKVSRNSKFPVAYSVYPLPVYPPHVKGNLYIMPRQLALKILHVAEYMPYITVEDVHITGILAKIVGARHENLAKGIYHITRPSSHCELALGKRMISQKIFAQDLHEIWERVLFNGLCKL